MNFKFAKTLLMGSVFTMGAFGLIACGDDSSSGADNGGEEGTSNIEIPTQVAPNIVLNGLAGVPAGTFVKFTGTASLDFMDSTSQNQDNLQFTSIDFKVGKIEGTTLKALDNVIINKTVPPQLPTSRPLNIAQMGISIDLNDPAFPECGDYTMLITVVANDQSQDFPSSAQVNFNRPDSYCKTVDPTPQPGPTKTEIAMTTFEVNLSTDAQPGLNLTTGLPGTAEGADLVFQKGANDVNIVCGAGVTIAPISNGSDANYCDDYEVGIWPEETANIGYPEDKCPGASTKTTAYVSDFKYKSLDATSANSIINGSANQIYVVKTAAYDAATGAGFYAIAVSKSTPTTNGDYSLTVKVYKAAQ